MKYTIVVPCYNEEDNILPLYNSILSAMENEYDFDLLFVNDASTDSTLEKIKILREKDQRVKYISLLFNCGHQKAIYAGLKTCKGGKAVTMDADLQHPPHIIPEMIKRLDESSAHVVAGRREGKQKGFLKNLFSQYYYRLFSLSTGILLQPGISDFRVYSKQAVDILCSITEREPFVRGMIASLKLRVEIVDYQLHERSHGVPSYTFIQSLMMGVRALLRFSNFPLFFGILIGGFGICLSLLEGIHYLFLRLFTDHLVPGQAELMIFLALVASIILLQLSFLLRTVMQIMATVQNQPVYIVEEMTLESPGDCSVRKNFDLAQ